MRVVLLFFTLNLTLAASLKTFPPSAQRMLDTFPGKKVTLDLILALGMSESDSFRLIQSKKLSSDSALLLSQATTDYNISAKASLVDNKNEASGALVPERTQNTAYSLGVSKYTLLGTSFNAELSNSYTELTYPDDLNPMYASMVSADPTYESRLKLGITQRLWKDGLGFASRMNLSAAEKARDIVELEVVEASEEWALGLMQIFYNAWLAQSEVAAALENHARQGRLLSIMRFKANRGTAERPDVLQIEGNLIMAEEQVSNARQSLSDIWRQLVITLKMPSEFLTVDPEIIPVDLDNEFVRVEQLCGPSSALHAPPSETTTLKKLKFMQESAQLSLEASTNQMRPDVSLFASVSANGIDGQNSAAISRATSLEKPQLGAGISFSMPLSFYADKAQVAQNYTRKISSDVMIEQERGSLQASWENNCRSFFRLREQLKIYTRTISLQTERNILEERRFKLGQIPALNVIIAGNDLTQARRIFNKTAIDLRLVAWKVLRMSGGVAEKLEKLQKLDSEGR